jgi:putative ABC transport system permease protein
VRGLLDALYRLILVAFPLDFRRRHGADMQAHFRAQRTALAGRPLVLAALWVHAIVDAVANGLTVRRGGSTTARNRRLHWNPAEQFLKDLQYAARGLRRDRGMTTVVVLTLTLGLAANTVMFGLVDQLLLQPPPGVEDAEGLRRIYFGSEAPDPSIAPTDRSSFPIVSAIRDRVPAWVSASAMSRHDVTLDDGPNAREAAIELVNASYFPLLGLRPAIGRFFTRAEDAARDAASVVVLGHHFWAREFGRRPDVLGASIRIEGKPFTIIGVAPAGFGGLGASPVDLWATLESLGEELLGSRWKSPSWFSFRLVGRLADAPDAVANAQATAALRQVQAELAQNDGPRFAAGGTAFVAPLHGLGHPNGPGDAAKVSVWLLGVAIVVLLIAMANVANVLMARTFGRRREIAVRLAMGVSRKRLCRQLLTESALLAVIAASVGLAVAYVGGRYAQQVLLPDRFWSQRPVDVPALGVTLGLIAVVTFGAGLAPAFYALRTDILSSLRTASRTAGGGGGPLRTTLLILQVTLSVLLLVGAGLFVRSLAAVRANDVGMDLDRLVLARIPARANTPVAELERLHEEAVIRLEALRGVERVSITRGSSPMGISSATTVRREGEAIRGRGQRQPFYAAIDPGYFATVGATFEQGRAFTAADLTGNPDVVVINRAFKNERWPNENPVGQCLYFGVAGGPCTVIIGVVENILHYDRVDTSSPHIYLPPTHAQMKDAAPRGLLVRTSAAPASLLPDVRRVLQSLEPDMPFVPADTLEALTAPQLQSWRLGSTMFLIFGGIALVIAGVGLYGAMAYTVSLRTPEIGIRLALGASRRHVTAQIARHGAASVAAGLALGLLLAAFSTRWLADLLYETSPRDPLVFALVAMVLAAASLAAAVGPVRRSAAVDPLSILRAE